MCKTTRKLWLFWCLFGVGFFVLPTACVLQTQNPAKLHFFNPADVIFGSSNDFRQASFGLRTIRVGDTGVQFQYFTDVDRSRFDRKTGLFVPWTMGCAPSDNSGGNSGGSGGNSNGTTGAAPDVQNSATQSALEADLVRVHNQTLYWLSESKGLLSFSIADPTKPRQLGKLPITGRPVEMFVEKSRAVILVTRLFQWKKGNEPYNFQRKSFSQLLLIDLKNPASPRITGTIDLPGTTRAGLIRQRGDVLYVATYTPKWTLAGTARATSPSREQVTLSSVLADGTRALRLLDKKEMINDERHLIWQRHPWGLNFKSLVMTVRDNAVMLAEQWEFQEKLEFDNCATQLEWPVTRQKTYLHLIDISDTNGSLKLLHKGYHFAGLLQDQFKQSFVRTSKSVGHYFGVVSYRVASEKCQSVMKNAVFSLEYPLKGGAPKPLHELFVGKKDEDTRGSLFDHKRGVLYVITATARVPRDWKDQKKDLQTPPPPPRIMDPLYAISLKDPAKLKKLSEIDHLNGDISLFQALDGTQTLVAVGRDDSEHCTGFEVSPLFSNSLRTKLAVSLVDVKDLTNIKLMQRRCVEVSGLVGGMKSKVNDDRGQAHKISTVVQRDALNMIMVPLQYRALDASGKRQVSFSAVGLMSWDLKKFKAGVSHKKQTVLQPFGTLLHADGDVKRALYLTPFLKDKSRHWIASLSDTALTISELKADRKTQKVATLKFGEMVLATYKMDSVWVEQVVPSHSPHSAITIRVRQTWNGPVIKEFQYGAWSQVARWKKWLVLVSPEETTSGTDLSKSVFRVLNFSNAANPVLALEKKEDFVASKRLFSPGTNIQRFHRGATKRNWWPLPDGLLFFSKRKEDTANNHNATTVQLLVAQGKVTLTSEFKNGYHSMVQTLGDHLFASRREATKSGMEQYHLHLLHAPTSSTLKSLSTIRAIPGYLIGLNPIGQSSFGMLSFVRQGNLMRQDQDLYVKELRQARTRIFGSYVTMKAPDKYKLTSIFDFPGWALRSTAAVRRGQVMFLQRSQAFLSDNPNISHWDKGSKLVYFERLRDGQETNWSKEKEIQTTLPLVDLAYYWNDYLIGDLAGEGLMVQSFLQGMGTPFVLRTPGRPTHFEPLEDQRILVSFGVHGSYLLDLAKKTLQPFTGK